MRLTLRTMLAYLDDVLDPADTQELEHKIEESSFASGLVHRVRDSMRRMRLGAPKLDGKGLGLDANTVADYLDSTLAPEKVPEFEKVCLESDVHLAEVASCHQILTLVLGEPAHVDAAIRERAYRIGHAENRQLKGTPVASGNGAPPAAASGEPVSPAVAQRPSQLPVKTLAITVLLGFLIALVALQAVGVNRLRGWFGLSSPRAVAENPASELPGAVEPAPATPSRPGPLSPASSESNAKAGNGQATPARSASEVAGPDSPSEPSIDARPVAPVGEALAESAEAPPDSAATVVARPAVEAGEIPPRGEATAPAGEVAGVKPKDASKPAEVAAVAPPKQVQVGRYISEEQVLARFDTAAGDWFRIAPDSPLLTEQRIISLPTYRPVLVLSSNMKVTLVGETHLQFGQTGDAAAPVVKIDSGRAIVVPLGDPEATVYLEAAGRAGSVSFADAESVLAVEVMKYLPPGQQPGLDPAIPIIQVFALSGHVVWMEEGAEEFVVSAGQVLTIAGADAPALYVADEIPSWTVGKDLADIDRLASAELRPDLATDRPLSLSLLERTEFRQVEVRSLACRSLCSLDMFDPAIKALDGAGLRSYWYAQFDALRGAMARSPEAANKLQRSLEKLAGDDAGLMYELLCGFNPEQLLAGGAKELVDALEHERVGTRVLAYENLRRITDKTQLFRPEQPPAQQKGEVLKWRRNLDSGAIVYLHPPSALPAREPVVAEASGEPPATE